MRKIMGKLRKPDIDVGITIINHPFGNVLYQVSMVINSAVGGLPNPLKNMSTPIGRIIPNLWKKTSVPNHQSDIYILYI